MRHYQIMNNHLLILTSRKNYTWISMEEIISWIETIWKNWAIKRNIFFKIINVDDNHFSDLVKSAMQSEAIVVTCFNTSISNSLYSLRKKLSINVPWIFYIHGLASFGSWPLFYWKIGQLLTTKDIFIGSCQRDKDQFKLIFKNLEHQVIPFGLLENSIARSKTSTEKRKFSFIGRISSQKNLHTLLFSLSILKKLYKDSSWEMHFFGKEDNYGSPLMGVREKNYQKFLENLTSTLGLTKNIFFHGFVKRNKIDKIMEKEKWTFISPSLHSDENFGMAAFRSLLNGHNVILSDWGGHRDFFNEFSGPVKLVPVYKSSIGPFIDPMELATLIHEKTNLSNILEVPDYYSISNIESKFDLLWSRVRTPSTQVPAMTSSLLSEILDRREQFLKIGSDGAQIYSDYQDTLKDPFFDAYGQRKYNCSYKESIHLCPWVEESSSYYLINDPHRGQFSLPKTKYHLKDLLPLGLAWGH